METKTCFHDAIELGPRVPLRYGSAPTEVCKDCGAYRTMHHTPGRWQSGPPDTKMGDDE